LEGGGGENNQYYSQATLKVWWSNCL